MSRYDEAAAGVLGARWNTMRREGWRAERFELAPGQKFYELEMVGPLPGAKAQQLADRGIMLVRGKSMQANAAGEWAYISPLGEPDEQVFVPDLKITEDNSEYVLIPARGYSGSLIVIDINDRAIGWMPIEVTGYDSVKDWMVGERYFYRHGFGRNARRRAPKPSSGYSYEADAFDAPSEDWDTIMYTPTGREAFVGQRTIDGEMMSVWEASGRFIAQTPQMSRNVIGKFGFEIGDPADATEFARRRNLPGATVRYIGRDTVIIEAQGIELGSKTEMTKRGKVVSVLYVLPSLDRYNAMRALPVHRPNAEAPPPPPRRRRTADPSLRRVRAIVEREERPFEPERRYPRETKPHHFVVNAGLEQWREPDEASEYSAVWYGPGGRAEAEQATEIEGTAGGWYVREYQHLAGYVDDFDPDEPFLVTETHVSLSNILAALEEGGLSEPDDPVELMRYAVAFGVAELAERGGAESYASELP